MYYVYILKSEKDDRLYIGSTGDLDDRLLRHNSGRVVSTKNRRPLRLLCYKEFDTRSEAVNGELYLKKLKGGRKFKEILDHWGVAKW